MMNQVKRNATHRPGCHSEFSKYTDAKLFSLFDDEYNFLMSILNLVPTSFNTTERRQLFLRNRDVFYRHEFDVADLMQHGIDTGNVPPISEPSRRHAGAHLDLNDDTVDRIMSANIIEPAVSPWPFNVVLVKRKNSGVPRVTIDNRRLDSLTVADHIPKPRIKDCLDALAHSTSFTTLL